jgi:hypothetical protein
MMKANDIDSRIGNRVMELCLDNDVTHKKIILLVKQAMLIGYSMALLDGLKEEK